MATTVEFELDGVVTMDADDSFREEHCILVIADIESREIWDRNCNTVGYETPQVGLVKFDVAMGLGDEANKIMAKKLMTRYETDLKFRTHIDATALEQVKREAA